MEILVGVFGAIVAAAGVVILIDFGGAARALIRRVTSRNLGSLAPGYAADPMGMKVYSVLLIAFGMALVGVGLLGRSPILGALAVVAGSTVFVIASALIVIGEVRMFRALPKEPPAG